MRFVGASTASLNGGVAAPSLRRAARPQRAAQGLVLRVRLIADLGTTVQLSKSALEQPNYPHFAAAMGCKAALARIGATPKDRSWPEAAFRRFPSACPLRANNGTRV